MSAINRMNNGEIYHYTSIISSLNIIENRSLHLRNIEYMNDPNELRYLNSYLQSYQKRNSISTKVVANILSEVKKTIAYYDVFVFSTSSNKDSSVLRKKYGDISIGFNITKLRKLFKSYEIADDNGNDILFIEDGEILYSESKKRDIIDENIKAYIFHHTTNQKDHIHNTILMRTYLYLYSIFFKNFKKWFMEEEYRFAFFIEKEYAKRITQTKLIEKRNIPYISINLHDNNIEHPFEEIVIGPKKNFVNDKEVLMKLLYSKNYFNDLKSRIMKSEVFITSKDCDFVKE